jgi:hypothetical protein
LKKLKIMSDISKSKSTYSKIVSPDNKPDNATFKSAPINTGPHKGFALQFIATGKNTLHFFNTLFNRAVGKSLLIFRAFIANHAEKPVEVKAPRPVIPAEQLQRFKNVRMAVMREVRQQNLEIFRQELQLSAKQLSKIMRSINVEYDALYDAQFDFEYDKFPEEDLDDDHAAALWTAHACVMPLCKSPLADYAWQYSAAMEALSDEIAKLIERRSGIKRLATATMRRESANSPYAHNPQREALFPLRAT